MRRRKAKPRRQGVTRREDFVTRFEASQILGVSKERVRSLHASGELHGVVGASREYLYRRDDVEALARKRAPEARASVASFSAETFAKVADELEKGTTPLVIVKTLGIHPTTFETVFEAYKRLAGALVLSASEVRALAGDDAKSGAELVAIVAAREHEHERVGSYLRDELDRARVKLARERSPEPETKPHE